MTTVATTPSLSDSIRQRDTMSPRINSMMLIATTGNNDQQKPTTPNPSPRGALFSNERTGSLLRSSRASSRGMYFV